MTETIVRNAVCLACGCVCDDIDVHTSANRVRRAERACELGAAWFASHDAHTAQPAALVDGAPVALDDALQVAAEALRTAHYPLVFGLGQASTEAQRAAVALAEALGGAIEGHTALTHGTTRIAAQLVGEVGASLGEVRNRADVLLFWGTNPAESHPRHFERYSAHAVGKFVPNGRAGRTVLAVDVRPTPTTCSADHFFQIRPNADFEALTVLRALLRGAPVRASAVAETGLPVERLRELLEHLTRARYAAVFLGTGLTGTRGKHMNAAAVFQLVADLNAVTKCVALPMRDHGNEMGTDQVLSWTGGHPLALDFSRGTPRSFPGEFSAVDLLRRGDVDAALIVGDAPWAPLPRPAVERLKRIPTVIIDSRVGALSRAAKVHITAAIAGLSSGGTAYRTDRVPLALRPALASPHPPVEELLARLHARAAG